MVSRNYAIMAILKRTILVFFIASAACLPCPAASAEEAAAEVRIGLIGADPEQLLKDFDLFADYLRSSLKHSGIRDVSVFIARDLNQMRSRIRKGKLDFVLTTAYPVLELERQEIVPALVALQGGARDESAVFFVRKQSGLQELGDLRGKTLAFGTPWSTAGYAMAVAELKKNKVPLGNPTDRDAPDDAVRYTFAGAAINQAVRVIRHRASAGVFSIGDWEELPPNEQSLLRIIRRTAPVTRLLGSFHPSFPPVLREAVAQALIDMSGDRRGRAALAGALRATAFERLTEEDRNSLQRLKQELSEAD